MMVVVSYERGKNSEELQSRCFERERAPGFDQFAQLVVRVFAPGLALRGAEAEALARALA